MNYYSSPVTFQRGHGLGNVLAKVFRTVVPFFKKPGVQKGLKRIGNTLLSSSVSSLQDHINKGTPLRDSFRNKTKTAGSRILSDIQKQLVKPPTKRKIKGISGKTSKKKRTRLIRKLDVFDYR